MKKETIEIKGNLHLYGISLLMCNSSDVCCELFEYGIDLSFYNVPKGGSIENKVARMNYSDFLEKFRGKVVKVEGSITCHGEELDKGE